MFPFAFAALFVLFERRHPVCFVGVLAVHFNFVFFSRHVFKLNLTAI